MCTREVSPFELYIVCIKGGLPLPMNDYIFTCKWSGVTTSLLGFCTYIGVLLVLEKYFQ